MLITLIALTILFIGFAQVLADGGEVVVQREHSTWIVPDERRQVTCCIFCPCMNVV